MSEKSNLTSLETLVVSIKATETSCANTHTGSTYLSPNGRLLGPASIATENVILNDLQPNKNVDRRKTSKQRWKSEHQVQINASERERKGRLAANIKKLKEIIPLEPIKLQTKEIILEEAVKYICELKEKVDEMVLKDAPENLVFEMNKLQKKVEDLETERKFYQRVLQSHGLLNKLKGEKDDHGAKLPIPRCVKTQSKNEVGEMNSNSTKICTLSSTTTTNAKDDSCNSSIKPSSSQISSSESSSHAASSAKTSISSQSSSINSKILDEIASPGEHGDCFNIGNSGVTDNTISFPPFSPYHCKSNVAYCSPTYSMARIRPAKPNKTPTLCNILTDKVFDKDKTLPNNRSKITNTEKTPPISIDRSSSGAMLSVNGSNSNSTHLGSLSKYLHVTNSGAQISELRSLVESSTCVVSSGKSAVISCTAAPNASSLPASSDSLLSWLRSGDPISCSNANATASNLATNEEETHLVKISSDSSKLPVYQQGVITATTNIGKKETSSFNIASLMKSKAACSANQAASVSAESPCLSKLLSRDSQTAQDHDFATGTPKDVFHQSFENDILDCLQNGFTTPEPAAKNTSAANSDWVCLGDSNNSRFIQHALIQSYDEEVTSIAKDRPMVQSKHCFANHSNPNIAGPYINPVTTTSVLWQPAITHAPRSSSSFPTVQGGFSSISYPYLNNNNLQFSQSCSSANQSFNNPTVWITRCETASFTQDSSSRLTGAQLDANPTNLVPSKKRKFHQSGSKATKRRKSNLKSVVEQEDTHSISRLIGSQYSSVVASPAHQQMPTHPQRYSNPGASMSYESDRTSTIADRSQLFASSTPNAIAPSAMGYNNYGPQSNLFHSPPAINPQAPSYHHPPGSYFYNHPVAPHPPQGAGSMYVPRFANVNNSNNASPALSRQLKTSQHHIRQILS